MHGFVSALTSFVGRAGELAAIAASPIILESLKEAITTKIYCIRAGGL
jgi:hypothetical protein